MSIEDTIRHVVPCINPGLSCCPYRMTCSTKLVTNVLAGVWCTKWRQNRIKDKFFHFCEDEYEQI